MKLAKRILVIMGVLLLVVGTMQASFADENPLIVTLRTEINLLNLLNGLYLSNEQTTFILAKAKEVKTLRDEYESKLAQFSDQAEVALRNLKEQLLKNTGVSPEVERETNKLQQRAHELKESYDARVMKIAEEVRAKLNENQLVLLEEYKPCLIPPKNVKNPVRIGQVTDTSGLEKLLERIRNFTKEKFERRKNEILEKIVEHGVKKGYVEDVNKEKERVAQILETVRSLSDVEFEVKKQALALELLPPQKNVAYVGKKPDRVLHFLLNPKIIPLLEQRLWASK